MKPKTFYTETKEKSLLKLSDKTNSWTEKEIHYLSKRTGYTFTEEELKSLLERAFVSSQTPDKFLQTLKEEK